MQPTKFREIVRRASLKSGIEEEKLQSMADFVFREVIREMRSFNNLCIHLKGWFTWFYGKKRLAIVSERIDKHIQLEVDGLRDDKLKKKSFIGFMGLTELKLTKRKVKNLLDVYDVYIKEKKDAKNDRLQANTGRHSSTESGE